MVFFTFGAHCKCDPGTDKEVISIVMHLNRKMVPEIAKRRLIMINLSSYY